MTILDSKAYKYACWCIQNDNDKVPKYVKLQCEAFLLIIDGKNADAHIDEKAYAKLCKLLKLMVHPDLNCSMYDGLEEYMWLLLVAVFCVKNNQGNRYYETAVLEIARKQFKTFISAIIFILLMLTEPSFSRFFSVAPDLKLSSELKVAIRKIIKSSPALATDGIFKILRSEIRCLLTDSEYTPLSYSNDKLDGKLANAFLADECGAMDNYPIEAMRSSQITLKSKLGIIISTQYPNDNNAMIDEIDISKKTLDGFFSLKRFSLLYEPDDELLTNDQWKTNDLIIYQSNPVSVTNKDIFGAVVDMRNIAALYENKQENYLCKHNNIKYKSLGVEGYVDIIRVRECKIKEDLSFWRGKRVWLGLDLATTDDNVALAMVTYHDGFIYAKVWGFIPKDSVELKSNRENVDYKKLIRDKVCFACGGDIIGYGDVEDFILNLQKKYGVIIVNLGFDWHNAVSTVQKLESDEKNPIECVVIKQHSSVLHRPTKLLKESILRKPNLRNEREPSFRYDENEMLEINFSNSRCTEDTNFNKYVNKKKSAGKVDCVVALINAIYLLQLDLEAPKVWGAQVF